MPHFKKRPLEIPPVWNLSEILTDAARISAPGQFQKSDRANAMSAFLPLSPQAESTVSHPSISCSACRTAASDALNNLVVEVCGQLGVPNVACIIGGSRIYHSAVGPHQFGPHGKAALIFNGLGGNRAAEAQGRKEKNNRSKNKSRHRPFHTSPPQSLVQIIRLTSIQQNGKSASICREVSHARISCSASGAAAIDALNNLVDVVCHACGVVIVATIVVIRIGYSALRPHQFGPHGGAALIFNGLGGNRAAEGQGRKEKNNRSKNKSRHRPFHTSPPQSLVQIIRLKSSNLTKCLHRVHPANRANVSSSSAPIRRPWPVSQYRR